MSAGRSRATRCCRRAATGVCVHDVLLTRVWDAHSVCAVATARNGLPAATTARDMYVGPLFVVDGCKAYAAPATLFQSPARSICGGARLHRYGYATNTKVKFVVVFEDPPASDTFLKQASDSRFTATGGAGERAAGPRHRLPSVVCVCGASSQVLSVVPRLARALHRHDIKPVPHPQQPTAIRAF